MERTAWGEVCRSRPWQLATAFALLVLTGCGGANPADVAQLTGNPGATTSPGAFPTASLPLLVVAPLQTTLFAGLAAPPNCDGGSQTFVVSGGTPPFTISTNGGCLSTTSVAASGDSFTFTAGNGAGDTTITVTDALGQPATAVVTMQNPLATFIKVDVVESQRSDNGDGTFTSVVGALVTDASGVVVDDGVPVEFGLTDPVAGSGTPTPTATPTL